MYGTIARFRVKPGMEAKIEALSKTYEELNIPGAIDEWIYRSDEDPRTYYMAVLFDSKESYVKNAESPEQDKRYREMLDLLESDPEWHDGEVIFAYSQRQRSSKRAAA